MTEADQLRATVVAMKAWFDHENSSPAYPPGTDRDDPGNEAIWRDWWDHGIGLCQRVQDMTDAALLNASPAPVKASSPPVKAPAADPGCPYCGGSGERFWHAENCRSDDCALAGGIDDCAGAVEPCPCVPEPCLTIPPLASHPITITITGTQPGKLDLPPINEPVPPPLDPAVVAELDAAAQRTDGRVEHWGLTEFGLLIEEHWPAILSALRGR